MKEKMEKNSKKINPNHQNEVDLEVIKFIINYLEENNNVKAFKKASDRLQKLRAEGYYD